MSAYSIQSKNQFRTWILIFIFVSLVSLLFYVFGLIHGSPVFAFIGLAFSLGQVVISYFWGDKLALATSGGKEVDPQEAVQIHQIVDNLSKIAGIPKPRVFVSPDPSANAFACGRNPKNAKICLNQGLLDLLDKAELEGVIAHELAHIKNRDILVMTITMALSSVVSFIIDFGFRIALWGGFGGNQDRDSKSNNFVVLAVYIILMLLAPILSLMLQMAVSRSREYLADATAVVFTRYPDALVRALEKLYQNPTPTEHYATSMNHFYISPPKKTWGEKINSVFSTHPPIQSRIQALRSM